MRTGTIPSRIISSWIDTLFLLTSSKYFPKVVHKCVMHVEHWVKSGGFCWGHNSSDMLMNIAVSDFKIKRWRCMGFWDFLQSRPGHHGPNVPVREVLSFVSSGPDQGTSRSLPEPEGSVSNATFDCSQELRGPYNGPGGISKRLIQARIEVQ